MALTEERLARLLAYCKLTELAEDPEVQALVPALYEGAVEYMADAGIPEPGEGLARSRYDLCVDFLVLSAWDQRSVFATGTTRVDNPVFRWMLNQLKRSQPVTDPQMLADLNAV